MPSFDPARRALLRGRVQHRSDALRPPWAVASFIDDCTRCDACIAACTVSILVRGDGGFPEVDFRRGGCILCGDCTTACDSTALSAQRPWSHVAAVGAGCLSARGIVCRSCGDACEARALSFRLWAGGRALLLIDTSICNGCGACVAVCPENAIRMEEAA